jgi:phytoene dehydrogenase-like protein
MSIDAFDGGPRTPGSNASTLYHYLIGGGNVDYIMPRGGIGSLSEALGRRAQSLGAEVELKAHVKQILVTDGRATGVQLRDGTTISADAVLSSLDPYTTFVNLAGAQNFPPDYIRKIKEINFNLGYIQAHFTIDQAPQWIERLLPYMHDNGQWCPTVAYAPAPEYISDAWEQYRKGQLPDAPPTYLYIPSMVDSSLAPEGKHGATIFTPYFPTGLDADENRSWKEQYADTCVSIFDKLRPGSPTPSPTASCSPTGTSAAPSAHTPATTHMGCCNPTSCGPAASSRGPTSSPSRSTGSTCAANAPTPARE